MVIDGCACLHVCVVGCLCLLCVGLCDHVWLRVCVVRSCLGVSLVVDCGWLCMCLIELAVVIVRLDCMMYSLVDGVYVCARVLCR